MATVDRYLSYQKAFNGSVTATSTSELVLAGNTDLKLGGAPFFPAYAVTASGDMGTVAPIASLTASVTDVVLSNVSLVSDLVFSGDNSIRLVDTTGSLHDFTEASVEFADASGFSAGDVSVEADAISIDLTDVTLAVGDRIQLSLDYAPNAAPEFTSPAAATVSEGSLAVLDLSAGDGDGDALSFSITGGDDAARFEIVGDRLAFATAPDFELPDSADGSDSYRVEVTADDGWGGRTVQGIVVSVADANEAPVADDDAVRTAEDSDTGNLVAALLANDSDADGDTLRIVAVDGGSTRGSLQFDADTQTLIYDPDGAFASLREGETATDSFTYRISDGELTATAVATVTIDGVDTGPVVIVGTLGNDSLTDYANVDNTIWGDRLGTLTARGGNDRIFGRGGVDNVSGDGESIAAKVRGGDDVIQGGGGNDNLWGDATGILHGRGGNDTLVQGEGTGLLVGDALALDGAARGGDDRLNGVGISNPGAGERAMRPLGGGLYGDAATTMSGSSIGGSDTLVASAGKTASHLFGDARDITDSARGGNDKLVGGSAGDVLTGDAATLIGSARGGNDSLAGNGGGDTLLGDGESLADHARGGNDTLRGGAGRDVIYGDGVTLEGDAVGGNDLIHGDGGDDDIWGDGALSDGAAGGRDRIYLEGHFGDDTVFDFRKGEDKLVFTDLRPGELQITQVGGDTVITTLGDDSVTLVDFTGALRNGSDIIFA